MLLATIYSDSAVKETDSGRGVKAESVGRYREDQSTSEKNIGERVGTKGEAH